MAWVCFIDAERTYYSPSQIREGDTATLGELARIFAKLAENEGAGTKVVLRNDDGYTYGAINGWVINVEDCEDMDDYDNWNEEEEDDD